MKRPAAALIAHLVLYALAAPLGAQAPTPAAEPVILSGRVTAAQDGSPLRGATVTLEALGLSATTDAEGRYSLAIPADALGRTVELRAESPGLTPSSSEITLAPGPLTRDFSLSFQFAETITVGSRARATGTEVQKAVPVDVFTAEEVQTAGAAETNLSLESNRQSFREYRFIPNVMVDISRRTTATTVFGREYAAPFGIAPMGLSALTAYRGDIVLAKAAEEANVPNIMSGSSLIRH